MGSEWAWGWLCVWFRQVAAYLQNITELVVLMVINYYFVIYAKEQDVQG